MVKRILICLFLVLCLAKAGYAAKELDANSDDKIDDALLPIGTSLQAYSAVLTTYAGATPASGVATALATPSSANLATAVTDETGSGSLVFATSPTLVTPILGTPTSGTLTNCTGLPPSTGLSEFTNEDDFASASATGVNSSLGTQNYIDTQVATKENTVTEGSLTDNVVVKADLATACQWTTQSATTDADPYTLTPTAAYREVRVLLTLHADDVDVTLSETGATDQNVVKIFNQSDNTAIFATDGTGAIQTLGATVYLEQYESITFEYMTDRWVCIGYDSSSITVSALQLPNGTADVALTSAQVNLNTTDEQLSVHSAADGEISGEVAIPLIQHVTKSFDPVTLGNATLRRLPVFLSIGDDAPEGIIITEWKVSFDANPTDELEFDLKRADAFIGVANAAVVDVLDTTDGASTEDTNANINGGAAIANGKCLYLEQDAVYAETGHVVTVDIWYYTEED